MSGIVSRLKERLRKKSQSKYDLECDRLLVCDECGFKGKTKGYWGYYGLKFCCPVCLAKHYREDMEK